MRPLYNHTLRDCKGWVVCRAESDVQFCEWCAVIYRALSDVWVCAQCAGLWLMFRYALPTVLWLSSCQFFLKMFPIAKPPQSTAAMLPTSFFYYYYLYIFCILTSHLTSISKQVFCRDQFILLDEIFTYQNLFKIMFFAFLVAK